MTTTVLKAEVQSRINALTHPTPAAEILQNAVDTVGLDLDLTTIISVLNQATAAVTAATPADDITALNAASIALGVTSKPSPSASVTSLDYTVSAALAATLNIGDEVYYDTKTNNIRPAKMLGFCEPTNHYGGQSTSGFSTSVFMGDEDRYIAHFYQTSLATGDTQKTLRCKITDLWTGQTVSLVRTWTATGSSTVSGSLIGNAMVNPVDNTEAFVLHDSGGYYQLGTLLKLNTSDLTLSTLNGGTSGSVDSSLEGKWSDTTYTRRYTSAWCWTNEGNIIVKQGSSVTQSSFYHFNKTTYAFNSLLINAALDSEVSYCGTYSMIMTANNNLLTIDALGKLHLFEYDGTTLVPRAVMVSATYIFDPSYPTILWVNPTDNTEICVINPSGSNFYFCTVSMDETNWTLSPYANGNSINVKYVLADSHRYIFTDKYLYVQRSNGGTLAEGLVRLPIGTNGRLDFSDTDNIYKNNASTNIMQAYLGSVSSDGSLMVASHSSGLDAGSGLASVSLLDDFDNYLFNEVRKNNPIIGFISNISGTTVTVELSKGTLQQATGISEGYSIKDWVAIKPDMLFIPSKRKITPRLLWQAFRTLITSTYTYAPSALHDNNSSIYIETDYARIDVELSSEYIVKVLIINGTASINVVRVVDGLVFEPLSRNLSTEQYFELLCESNYDNNRLFYNSSATGASPVLIRIEKG